LDSLTTCEKEKAMNQEQRMILRKKTMEHLGGNVSNKRVGDFLYVHREADPRWLRFSDGFGNRVIHGGRGDSTDVIIELEGENKEVLRARLVAYLEELVGRHNEKLHDEWEKQFRGVTITLPYTSMKIYPDRYVIHTGSGCFYDQDEIAYEVMAALSSLTVYKALAPRYLYKDFARVDEPTDDKPVTFYHEETDVMVFFSDKKDDTSVCVRGPKTEKFERVMFAFFAGFVEGRTEKPFAREYGATVYHARNPADSVEVKITSEHAGEKCMFAVKLPYGLSFQSFPRLHFAKLVMECHKEDFLAAEAVTT
jgi:hypothetical protein